MSATMKRLAVASLALLAPAAAQVSAMSFLSAADLDRDGRVSFQELRAVGTSQDPPLTDDDLTRRFQRHDANQDGFLTGDELTAWSQNEVNYLKNALPNPVSKNSLLSEADREPQDGRISLAEAKVWGTQQNPPVKGGDITWRFDRRDYNKDGFLEREELSDFTKNEVDFLMKNLGSVASGAALVEVSEHASRKRGNLRKADNTKLFDLIMKQADLNPQDGHISFQEAKAWAASHFPGAREADVMRQFDEHDKDADGFLNLAELSTVPLGQKVA